jgi:tripartite ATP-independent transporter DctM subunit
MGRSLTDGRRAGDDPRRCARRPGYRPEARPRAGAIMAEGGMATRLVNLARLFVGTLRGGLALVNVIASTFFSGISGSSVADTASIGSVLIPQMIKRGYPPVFSINVTICGSVQAVLIPPSYNAVIYSLAAGGSVSIAHLFLGGVIPGLIFGSSIIALCLVMSYRRGYPRDEPVTLREAAKIALEAFWGLITVLVILGGILSGIFTATELAAVACLYAFLVTMFVYRDYKWRDLPRLIHAVIKTVAMVMILIGFSTAFGYMMALMQVPARSSAFFLGITQNKYAMLFMLNVLLLILGTFMDMAPMILALLLVIYVPAFSLWLPSILRF